jgi:hypothetical protein
MEEKKEMIKYKNMILRHSVRRRKRDRDGPEEGAIVKMTKYDQMQQMQKF